MKGFLTAAERLGSFEEIRRNLAEGVTPMLATGLSQIHKVHFAWALTGGSRLVLTPDEPAAVRMAEDLNRFYGEEKAVVFPTREFSFREVEGVSREYEFARLRVLESLAWGEEMVVVASAEAALQRTIPPETLRQHCTTLTAGQSISPEEVIARLLAAGYERRDQVDGVCQFSQRGGIIDFYPPHMPDPFRLEFWGDEIDSIAVFKTDTQRREDNCKRCMITPAREVLYDSPESFADDLEARAKKLRGKYSAPAKEHLLSDVGKLRDGLTLQNIDKYLPVLYERRCTLLDYLPEDAPLFVCEPAGVREELRSANRLMTEDMKVLFEEGVLFEGCDRYLMDYDRIAKEAAVRPTLFMDTFTRSIGDIPLKGLYNIDAVQLAVWGGELAHLTEDLDAYLDSGYTVCILAGTEKAGRALASDLVGKGYNADYAADLPALTPKKVYVLPGSLSAGFEYPEIRLAVFTHGRVGASLKKRRKTKQKSDPIRSLADLTPGDYVVHVTHGIGVFEGIIKREIHGVVKDYIKIRYAGTDMLFVPVTQLDLVSKYIGGGEDGGVRLNKLNSAEWSKTKARVKKAVADMADELIRLYAQRMQAKGYAFDPDNDWQREFEARFPYEETDDQLRCIDEIKHDMERPQPMDRLLCGDVGFGKTEVALRAAMKAIMDGKQVAFLSPTTILAQQHYNTMAARMLPYGVRLDVLSRFRSPRERKQVLSGLREGSIDIVSGTHALLAKDVAFKDLGLLIVDEEQRFGVAHKERIKQLKSSIDVLTLTATPIPRTLHMSLVGVRDMSVLDSAPEERYPVQTYVAEYSRLMVRDAILRELSRGGQVYFVYNRIQGIETFAQNLKELVPEARIGIGHGQMPEGELEKVMLEFYDGGFDVLLCTAIIENGLDIPRVNTIIVYDADKFGLSQLYQLKGRVGRSNRIAYAYFTFRPGSVLTETAEKRLNALREFTDMGSGFKIALRDLEIRGAGNMLGGEQHGHIAQIGYELYCRLVKEAVNEGMEQSPKRPETIVELKVDAYISEDYIRSEAQKVNAYKRIAAVEDEADKEDILEELIDRYGDPPQCVLNLINIAYMRSLASRVGITHITQRPDAIVMRFDASLGVNFEGLTRALSVLDKRASISAGDKLAVIYRTLGVDSADAVTHIVKFLENALSGEKQD